MLAVQTTCPRGALLAPVVDRGVRRRVVAPQVHLDDRVPLLGGHLRQRAVAQDAGVVDQRVEPAELLDGGAHDALAVLDLGAVADVQHGRATARGDLVDDGLAGRLVDLADDHAGSLARQLERLTPAEAPPAPVTIATLPSRSPMVGPYFAVADRLQPG